MPGMPTVLIVDDEQQFAEVLAERLVARGIEASTAFDAEAALAALRERDFDVVVLDIIMPGKDGIQALQEIKASKPLTEVIMLSGHARMELAVEGLQFGAFDFLLKPPELPELLDKINRAYERKADHAERIRKADLARNHGKQLGAAGEPSVAPAGATTDRAQLLVIGRENDFPAALIEHAVAVAKRMSFEILAMNIAGFDSESFRHFPAAREEVCRDFREISEKNVALFRQIADKAGIPFSHAVKCCGHDDAIAEVRKEFGDIEYVVCESGGEADEPGGHGKILAYALV